MDLNFSINFFKKQILLFFSSKLLLIFLFICVLFVIIGRLYNLENLNLTVWGDRDLWRGLEGLIDDKWTGRGPETNSGYRPIGGFFYHLLAMIFSIWTNVQAANLAVTILYAISIVIPSALLWRDITPIAGIVTALALTGAGLGKSTLYVWNPGFVIVFASTLVISTYLFVKSRNSVHLGMITIAAALGTQIHMQILVLVLAVPLILVLYRVRFKWSFPIAISMGLLIAYLPSIIVGGTSSLSGLSTGGLGANFSAYLSFNPELILSRLAIVLTNFLDATGGSFKNIGTFLTGRYGPFGIVLWIADGIAVMLACFAIFYYRPRGALRHQLDRPMGVFVVFSLTYFAIFAFAEVNFRHFVAVLPALSILVALGTVQLLKSLGTFLSPVAGAATALALLGFLGARSLITGGVDFGSVDLATDSYRAQREIATHVKGRYFKDRENFERSASLFVSGANNLRYIPQGLGDRMAVTYRLAPPNTMVGEIFSGCLAIIKKNASRPLNIPQVLEKARKKLRSLHRSITLGAYSQTDNFVYISYTSEDGNCLKTFPNPYIATTFEAQYLQNYDFAEKSGPLLKQLSTTRWLFIIPNNESIFPWAVEMIKDKGSIYLVLRGREFRGHTGLPRQEISDLEVIFRNKIEERVISFEGKTIGKIKAGTLAPWKSRKMNLPNGRYEVQLTGDTVTKGIKKKLNYKLGDISLFAGGLLLNPTPK